MKVWIRDVEKNERGRPGWVIFWAFSRNALRSDGRCYTNSDLEASVCHEARRIRRTVELQTVKSNLWERVQSVSLSPEEQIA